MKNPNIWLSFVVSGSWHGDAACFRSVGRDRAYRSSRVTDIGFRVGFQ
jgi:formylglycine-generating enzyme required for sulfatase activity